MTDNAEFSRLAKKWKVLRARSDSYSDQDNPPAQELRFELEEHFDKIIEAMRFRANATEERIARAIAKEALREHAILPQDTNKARAVLEALASGEGE